MYLESRKPETLKKHEGVKKVNKFRYQNFSILERTPTSPAAMEYQLNELMHNSTTCRAKVDWVNPTTGEYRIVLQGTVDYWDDKNTPTNQ
jgi:hypothetical protein